MYRMDCPAFGGMFLSSTTYFKPLCTIRARLEERLLADAVQILLHKICTLTSEEKIDAFLIATPALSTRPLGTIRARLVLRV